MNRKRYRSEPPRSNLARKRIRTQTIWCWLFMLPTVVLFLLFQGWPILSGAYYSMLDWSGMSSTSVFVGLGNFRELLKDKIYLNAIKNSFLYMLISVPLQLTISLGLAYILNNASLKFASVYRTLYFLPVITTASVVGIIMIFIFGANGPVNALIMSLGASKPINWLGSGHTALLTVVLIGVWKDVGIYMIYWLAALQSVPQDVYEAATMDGAGRIRTFFSIVLPIIMPIGGVISMLCVINSLKVFDIVQTMTEGGPFFSTDVVATFVYRNAYSSTVGLPRLGYASAAAMLFGILMMLTGGILTVIKKKTERYD